MTDDLPEVEIIVRGGHPDFLDLPWGTPLADWEHERIVPMAHGISRHVVRFVRYEHRVYAIKETEAPRAEAEHRVLRNEGEEGRDAVDGVHLPGQGWGKVETESVDVHLGHPVAQ